VTDGLLIVCVVLGSGLRLLNLTAPPRLDETITGVTARLPFGAMVAQLRHGDAHPPLDYLLRAPIARHSTAIWLLRLPSAAMSVAALVIFALWVRRFEIAGVVAVFLFAVSAFQLEAARQARMYAPLALVGLLGAVLTERWLIHGRRRDALCVGVVLTVGLFLHAATLLVAGGLIFIPGWRQDRRAWWWRGAILGALGCWIALWGPSFVDQQGPSNGAAYIPFATPSRALSAVAELIVHSPDLDAVTVLVIAAGAIALVRRDRPIGRVWLCGFLLPAAMAAAIGTRAHLLIPKTLAFAFWAPCLAAGAAAGWIGTLPAPRILAALPLVAFVVVPSTARAVVDVDQTSWSTASFAPALDRLDDLVHTGDGVAAFPGQLVFPAEWHLSGPAAPRPLAVDIPSASAFLPKGRTWQGTLWLIEYPGSHATSDNWLPCGAPSERIEGYRISCLRHR